MRNIFIRCWTIWFRFLLIGKYINELTCDFINTRTIRELIAQFLSHFCKLFGAKYEQIKLSYFHICEHHKCPDNDLKLNVLKNCITSPSPCWTNLNFSCWSCVHYCSYKFWNYALFPLGLVFTKCRIFIKQKTRIPHCLHVFQKHLLIWVKIIKKLPKISR